MTRPHIIRADTHDLQDHESPSAKDHTRQPTHPAALGDGPPAPHQAVALKNAEQEGYEHHPRSPRVSQDLSNKELQLLHEEPTSHNPNDGDGASHESNLQRNGRPAGTASQDEDMGDVDGDDNLEDDMMDKISSSPSIDDGGCLLPLPWPSRGDSLFSTPALAEKAPSSPQTLSSSPFISTPPHFPLAHLQKEHDTLSAKSEDHHQQGGYTGNLDDELPPNNDDELPPKIDDVARDVDQDYRTTKGSENGAGNFSEDFNDLQDSYDADYEENNLDRLLLPADDPLLDNSFDDALLDQSSSGSSSPTSRDSWEDRLPNGNDDDTEDISFSDDTRFVDSGWGGECLRELEDIDFEFVYALHTFVATVEGQANATKGDTMVLLDDSNSYWWLVRVVKDSSIGYLPAEHIETPTERLARLNKHRNIDLSQTMLGDNPEKSKNPLKKAMWRRNAKTVQFAAPTYVEASDVEYSTDEEEVEGEYFGQEEEEGDEPKEQGQGEQNQQDQIVTVDPIQVRGQGKENKTNVASGAEAENREIDKDQITISDKLRSSEESPERSGDDISDKSRKGTVRNTDSFFKDENVETRKINLTPSLLRDDSNSSVAKPIEPKELKPRGSFDKLEKVVSPPEKVKDDRKRKERKPGMLSGLFKRRDRKSKGQDEEAEDGEKVSGELSRQSPSSKESLDNPNLDNQAQKSSTLAQPQRQTSKLQKNQPAKVATLVKPSQSREGTTQKTNPVEPQTKAVDQFVNEEPAALGAQGPQLTVPSVSGVVSEDTPSLARDKSLELTKQPPAQADSPKDTRRGMFSPIRDVLRSSPSSSEPKPEKVKQAKQRVAMDDFDSSPDEEEPSDPMEDREEEPTLAAHRDDVKERLSESPVQIALQDSSHAQHPPALMIDTSSQEDRSVSPVSPASSVELIEAPQESHARDEDTPASTAQSSSMTPTWSDASLRTYLEDDSDIRDLLVVVHDKSDVKPVGPDHPFVGKLFKEENRRLGELSNRLDGMLVEWLARKSKAVPRSEIN